MLLPPCSSDTYTTLPHTSCIYPSPQTQGFEQKTLCPLNSDISFSQITQLPLLFPVHPSSTLSPRDSSSEWLQKPQGTEWFREVKMARSALSAPSILSLLYHHSASLSPLHSQTPAQPLCQFQGYPGLSFRRVPYPDTGAESS